MDLIVASWKQWIKLECVLVNFLRLGKKLIREHEGNFCWRVPFCVQCWTADPFRLYPSSQRYSIDSLYWNVSLFGSVAIWRGDFTLGCWHVIPENEDFIYLSFMMKPITLNIVDYELLLFDYIIYSKCTLNSTLIIFE